jgi:hypothetical protein
MMGNTYIGGNPSNGISANDGKFADGRPRAMHSINEVFGDGRVWFPGMSYVSSGPGDGADWVLSYNRDMLGSGRTRLAYTPDNLGPWVFHGRTNGGFINNGRSVFDRAGHRIVSVGNPGDSVGTFWVEVPTAGANLGKSTAYSAALYTNPSWCVIAHDLGILVCGHRTTNNVHVMDLASRAWTKVTNVSGTGYYASGAQGVYVAANHTIGVGDPRSTGQQIYRLSIPTADGAYSPGGTWTWSLINPLGSGPGMSKFARPGSDNGAQTKWNIIEDMGNGQAALVFCGNYNGPTQVYKIASTGL